MDGLGEQLFPRAALPFQEDGGVAFRNLLQDSEEALHLLVFADHIQKRVLAGQLFSQLLHHAQIPECLHPADNLSLRILEQSRRNADRDSVPFQIYNEDGLIDNGPACFHGMAHGALLFAYTRSKYLPAVPTDGLLLFDACYLFSRSIEGCDPEFSINGEHTVRNTVQNDLRLVFERFNHEVTPPAAPYPKSGPFPDLSQGPCAE